jgi:hypothetical protein
MKNPFENKAIKFATEQELRHLMELANSYKLDVCKSIFSTDFPYYTYLKSMVGYGVTNFPDNVSKITYSDFIASLESKPTPNHTEQKPDMVNHPPHYTVNGIEVIDVIENYKLNYRLGNVVKYVLRADLKGNRLQDLKKALWYLQREIEQSEKQK